MIAIAAHVTDNVAGFQFADEALCETTGRLLRSDDGADVDRAVAEAVRVAEEALAAGEDLTAAGGSKADGDAGDGFAQILDRRAPQATWWKLRQESAASALEVEAAVVAVERVEPGGQELLVGDGRRGGRHGT